MSRLLPLAIVTVAVSITACASTLGRSGSAPSGSASAYVAAPTASTPLSATPTSTDQQSVTATATPSASPTGVGAAPPADGVYLCDGGQGTQICADSTGLPASQPELPAGSFDSSIDPTAGWIYSRVQGSNAHGNYEQIDRVALHGGPIAIVVQGPQMSYSPGVESSVSFGSPVGSPDGTLLAYGEMTLTNHVPIPGSPQPVVSNPNAPHPPDRLVQILIRNLGTPTAPPVIVPASMVGSNINAGPLLGWSIDGRELYLVGPNQRVDAVDIGSNGVATAVHQLFDPAQMLPGCQQIETVMSPTNIFYVVGDCATSIQIRQLRGTSVTGESAILGTHGLSTSDVRVDTSGQLLTLGWFAPPQSPQCVEVGGSARVINDHPTDITTTVTPGCIFLGPGSMPPPASSPTPQP